MLTWPGTPDLENDLIFIIIDGLRVCVFAGLDSVVPLKLNYSDSRLACDGGLTKTPNTESIKDKVWLPLKRHQGMGVWVLAITLAI